VHLAIAEQAITTVVSQAILQPKEIISIGTLESAELTEVQAQMSGRVQQLMVAVGDAVKAGQVVAKIEPNLSQETLSQAKAEYAKAKVLYAGQQKIVRRLQGLVASGAATMTELQTAQTKLQAVHSDVKVAKASFEKALFAFEKSKVRAVLNGVVDEVKVTVGSVIAAGMPGVITASQQKLKAVLPLPQRQRNLIKVGQAIELTSPTADQLTYQAKVTQIKPLINRMTRSFEVIAMLDNPGGWHPGASVRASIKVNPHRQIVLVPQASLVTHGGRDYVYLIKGGRAYQQQVVRGKYLPDGRVEVLQGLSGGEVVAQYGAAYLHDREPVRVGKE
jgi:RND family efflux transporter MFP subunit